MDIDYTLRNAYCCSFRSMARYRTYGRDIVDGDIFTHFMEIPLVGDTFRVPLLATRQFMDSWREHCEKGTPMIDCIAAYLSCTGASTDYKTINPIMDNVLNKECSCGQLLSIHPRGQSFQYYGCAGAIFDEDLKPMAVQAWVFHKKKAIENGKDIEQLTLVRPELWVNPEAYLNKADMVQKFIANKMIGTLVGTVVYKPDRFYGSAFDFNSAYNIQVRIILDQWPYKVRKVSTPSISTSNEELIQLALDHKEELLQ